MIPGFAALRRAHPDAGLIVVPHEPTRERLDAIREALEKARLPFRLLSSLKDEDVLAEPVVVADGVGYLAELYRAGAMAYVGGSFTTGVHNVMEPAVLKLPVFFGPRIDNSFEARELVRLGAGRDREHGGRFRAGVRRPSLRPEAARGEGRHGGAVRTKSLRSRAPLRRFD